MKPVHCADKKKLPAFKSILIGACLFFAMPVSNAQSSAQGYPKCSRDHPGKASRIESLIKNGDSRMILSCAGHTMKYAIARYGIQDMFNEANVDANVNGNLQETYQALKMKSGGLYSAALFFREIGYQDFDKYSQCAAGILLGIFRIGNTKEELVIPTYWQNYIEVRRGLKTASAISNYFTQFHIGNAEAATLGTMVSSELTKAALDRKEVFIPYNPYSPHDLAIEEAVRARRLYGNTNTPTPDKRDAADTRPTRESDLPVDWVPADNECWALLKQCEDRNRELEEKIKQFESKGGANNEVPSSVSIEGGYESIYLKVVADEVEVQVKVNGKLVGTYNKGATVYLDPFLKQNAMNSLSFIFSGVPKYFDNVDLDGKFPGNVKWFDIYNFAPKPGKLEGKLELPFAGKRN